MEILQEYARLLALYRLPRWEKPVSYMTGYPLQQRIRLWIHANAIIRPQSKG